MQEAANDLVKTEDDMEEEPEGERRKEDETGEEGGAALMEEVGDKAGGGAVDTPEQGVGEVVGVGCTRDMLLKDKTMLCDISFAEAGGGEGAVALNGEERGEAGLLEEVSALKGDGERCLRLVLKAGEVLLRSLSWPWLAFAGVPSRLKVSRRHAEEGRLPVVKEGLYCTLQNWES